MCDNLSVRPTILRNSNYGVAKTVAITMATDIFIIFMLNNIKKISVFSIDFTIKKLVSERKYKEYERHAVNLKNELQRIYRVLQIKFPMLNLCIDIMYHYLALVVNEIIKRYIDKYLVHSMSKV